MNTILKLKVTLLLLTIILLPACNKQSTDVNQILNTSTAYIFNELTSDAHRGRRVEDNQKTVSFIESEFEKLNMEYLFGDSYLLPYTHKGLADYKGEIEVSINKNGELVPLNYGSDFIFSKYVPCFNGSYEIAKYIDDDTKIDNKAVFLSSDILKDLTFKEKECIDKNAAVTIYEYDVLVYRMSKDNYTIPKLIVPKGTLNNATSITLKWDFEETNTIVNNVVGKISGKNSNNALVISAHFDHLGAIGNNIFYGAADNASGTTVLIHTMKLLKEYYSDKQPDIDIIICAFNGEEQGLQGSKSFVDSISDLYTDVININIDMVYDESKPLLITNENTSLANVLLQNLNILNCEKVNEVSSDHASFISKGYYGLTLTQELPSYYHTVNDTKDKVNINYLNTLSTNLKEAIVQMILEPTLFDISHEQCECCEQGHISEELPKETLDNEFQLYIKKETAKLSIDEVKFLYVEKLGDTVVYKNHFTYSQISELEKDFPFIDIGDLDNIPYDFEKIDLFIHRKSIEELTTSYASDGNWPEESLLIMPIKPEDVSIISIVLVNTNSSKQRLTVLLSKVEAVRDINVNFNFNNTMINGSVYNNNIGSIDWYNKDALFPYINIIANEDFDSQKDGNNTTKTESAFTEDNLEEYFNITNTIIESIKVSK